MNVFQIGDKGLLEISAEAYTLLPFKKIWNKKNKKLAEKELAFVYYFTDYNSDFSDILNESEKIDEIKKSVGLEDRWEMSVNVKNAIEFYKKRQRTASMDLLDSALEFSQKLKDFYKSIDLDERDKNGKLVHNIPQLQSSMNQLSDQTEVIRKLKETITKELQEASRVRGGEEVGYFENPE